MDELNTNVNLHDPRPMYETFRKLYFPKQRNSTQCPLGGHAQAILNVGFASPMLVIALYL